MRFPFLFPAIHAGIVFQDEAILFNPVLSLFFPFSNNRNSRNQNRILSMIPSR